MMTRFSMWRLAIEKISERPIVGYGLGTAVDVVNEGEPEWSRLDTHNTYLAIAIEVGIVGAIALLAVYAWVVRRALPVILNRCLSQERRERLILFAALVGSLFISGWFEQTLVSRGSIQQFFLAFGVAAILSLVLDAAVVKPPRVARAHSCMTRATG